MAERPSDIQLPPGFDWERVEALRAAYGIADNMVPVGYGTGIVAWGTINSARQEQREQEDADDMFGEEPSSDCAHEWAYTGTQYGGDDPSFFGEGRCYCIHCGEDGDA